MQVGFYTCAFFLSRSYVILLYIMLGLVTGWYAGAQERWAGLTTFRVHSDWVKWCVASAASTVGLWLIVNVLFILAGRGPLAAPSPTPPCSPRSASTPPPSSLCRTQPS